jgi:C4-dicarboxylate-specific signal transduction histidine kinase
MKKPGIPQNEHDRLEDLIRLEILDTESEPFFDDLTKLASEICGTKISLISLIDSNRQWFKSKIGLEASETPREISWCGHAILADGIFEIPDAELDERFKDNPLYTGEPHVRFYAGAPLKTSSGYNIGTLCVIDSQPKNLNDWQRSALKKLANQVVLLLEARLREKKLKIANEKLDVIVKNIPLNLVIYDKEGEISWVNEQWQKDLNYSDIDLLKKDIAQFITTNKSYSFLSSNYRWERLKIKNKSLQDIFVNWINVPLNSSHFLGIAKNIHQQVMSEIETQELEKSLEEQKMISQHQAKLASLGQLAAGVGHEINNPLAIIKGFLHALEIELNINQNPDSKPAYLINKINHATDRIVNIVKGLKSFSRANTSDLANFSLNDALSNTIQLISEIYKKEGVTLKFQDSSTAPLFIYGSKGRMEQVFLNLIHNAKDAMEDSPEKVIEMELKQVSNKAVFSIHDQGKGIPDEIKDKIFDPFFTTKDVNKGTGIGLSIVASIIKEMDGIIKFETSPGKGTTFYIEILVAAK